MFNNGFLRHPQQSYNPCYRKVICYSFFKHLKEHAAQKIGEDTFKHMLDQIEKNQLFLHKGLLEIYPTEMDGAGSKGCLAVDPSNGCFPLVLYPYSHTQFDDKANKTRASGFKTAAKKVQKKRSEIFNILTAQDEWTLELEARLEKLFEYPPQKKSAANDSNFNDGSRRRKSG